MPNKIYEINHQSIVVNSAVADINGRIGGGVRLAGPDTKLNFVTINLAVIIIILKLLSKFSPC